LAPIYMLTGTFVFLEPPNSISSCVHTPYLELNI
jgi:hypothetical protein